MLFRKRNKLNVSPGRIAWHKFRRNPVSLVSLFIIAMAMVVSVLGYLITPDPTPFCNEQYLQLETRKPGFRVKMLKIARNQQVKERGILGRMVLGKPPACKYVPINAFRPEECVLVVEEFNDIPGEDPVIREYSYADILFALKYDSPVQCLHDTLRYTLLSGEQAKAPAEELRSGVTGLHLVTKRFLLGTDRFGRDLLSRLLIGTRISLSVGLVSVIISLLIGITLGAVAGYFRGVTDKVIMWLINVVWSVPTLLMVIAITLVAGKGFWQIFIAVGLTMWVEVARVVRGQVLSVREKEYIEAARVLGYNDARILFRHILPNVTAPVIIISAANFASAILIEAGLSFLGIGIQPPVPSWGNMIRDHYGYIIVDMGYLAILPGLAIMLMVLAFTMLGNGLRDALDTRNL